MYLKDKLSSFRVKSLKLFLEWDWKRGMGMTDEKTPDEGTQVRYYYNDQNTLTEQSSCIKNAAIQNVM